MGTNYYFYEHPACPHCGHRTEPLHIGKSSAGWCFSLHVYPTRGIMDLHDWNELWMTPNTVIEDEYGKSMSAGEMYDVVANRSHQDRWGERPYMYESWEQFHQMNYSEQGPNGLLRHQVDGTFCIGQGPGTYDYLVGEFS